MIRRLIARYVLGERDGPASSTARLVALATLARARPPTRSKPSTLPIASAGGRHRAAGRTARPIGER